MVEAAHSHHVLTACQRHNTGLNLVNTELYQVPEFKLSGTSPVKDAKTAWLPAAVRFNLLT